VSFFNFFDTNEMPKKIDTPEKMRVYREIIETLDIAEELMYELVPKALFYYLNLESSNVPQASVKEIEKLDNEEEIEDEEIEGEETAEVKEKIERPIKPINSLCLLQ